MNRLGLDIRPIPAEFVEISRRSLRNQCRITGPAETSIRKSDRIFPELVDIQSS